MKSRLPLSFALLTPLLIPLSAWAHPGHALQPGAPVNSMLTLVAGMLHPFSGMDHLLAMLGVGMWSAQLGGRARWAVPLSFVLMMIVGAVLGMQGAATGAMEQVVTASVLVVGLLVATATRMSLFTSLTLVGSFALFHGYAHGAEMGSATKTSLAALAYVAGFAASSMVLQTVGYKMMQWFLRHAPQAAPASGVLIAFSGAMLCMGVVA